ncbi:hypothetical protein AB1L88_22715 [Tautonia sp. JC769]|uniref:hypothetical protein n=1 Tax=Tautonia sp. JC769 TaxID=3232135 RepID=UPI00345916C5
MNGFPEHRDSATGRPWLLDLKTFEPTRESPEASPSAAEDRAGALPADALGLALSGDGIRGAAFGLGMLQAMARAGWLRRVDYLSTVSGGGYIGAFLGRYFDAAREQPGEPGRTPGAVHDRVARGLIGHDSPPIEWLRRHSDSLTPGGPVHLAGFLRNLLAVYVVLGVTFLALFGVLNAVGYSPSIVAFAVRADHLLGGLSPLTWQLPEGWAGPWLVLAELSLWLGTVPLMVAYWLVSQDLPESFIAAVLVASGIIAASLTFLTGGALPLAILAAAVLWAIASWAAVRRSEGPADPAHPYRLSLARDHLTGQLAIALVVTLSLAAFAALDGVSRWLALLMIEGGLTVQRVSAWLVSVGTAVVGSATLLRMLVVSVAEQSPGVAAFKRGKRRVIGAAIALVLGVAPPLIALSFVSHASYQVGRAYTLGLAVTAVAGAVSLLFGTRECVPFINRSSPLDIAAGRLARSFLGAVNPDRRRSPEGQDASRPVAGDDVPWDRYRPDRAGGPLHVINCAISETIDMPSHRKVRDRQAENLAVGPVGVSVARDWHASWVDGPPPGRPLRPFLDGIAPDPWRVRSREPAPAESLSLREWIAVSGSAAGHGLRRRPGVKGSLLSTLANARLGYWWDSGIDARDRDRPDSPPDDGPFARLGSGIAGLFRAQGLLLSELTGRFGGPWLRHWYLSDGGFFEATGAYELLRRRLPYVILCDASEDPDRVGSLLAELVRLARIDFGAEISEISLVPEALRTIGIPEQVLDHLGTLEDLHAPAGGVARRHAALLRVRYPEAPPGSTPDPWLSRRQTWLLYLKPTCTGDESADVRSYAASHPDFPNGTTLDQNFDEARWESYRKLGEHIGSRLFVTAPRDIA